MSQTYRFDAQSGNVYEFERPDDMPEDEFLVLVEKDLATIAQQRAQEQQQTQDPSLAAAKQMIGKGFGMAGGAAEALGGMLSGQPPQQLQDLAGGAMEGMRRFGSGPVQAGYGIGEALGAADPGAYDRFTQAEAQQRQEFDASKLGQSPWAQGGVMAGEIAPAMAFPVAGGPGLGAIAANTALGAALGGTQYVPEGGDRMQNAVMGGAIPAALGGLGRAYSGAKKFLGKGVEPRAAEVAAMGQKMDVPVYAADIGGPGTQVTGTLMENAPIGMRTARLDQAKAADVAIDTVEKKLAQYLVKAPTETAELLRREVERGGAHKDIAAKGLALIKEEADDWGKVMQGSTIRKMAGRKILSKENYDHVSQLAEGMPKKGVTNVVKELDSISGEFAESTIKGPEQSFINDKVRVGLEKFRNSDTGVLEMDFNQLRRFRQELSSVKRDYYKGDRSLVGDAGVQYLERLDDAIEKDMDKLADTYGGQIKDSYLKAKTYYHKYIVPYTDKDLTRAMNNEKWDEAFQYFMKGGQQRAKLIYDQMDSKGKAAMRYGLFKEAVDNATGEKGISLAKLATNLHKQRKAANVIFKGTDYDIEGMGNLFRHIERASQVRESKPTGNRFVQAFLSGYSLINPGQIPAIAGGIVLGHGARAGLNSNWMRDYLIAASRLKPGSKEMEALVTKIDRRMASAGIATSQTLNRELSEERE